MLRFALPRYRPRYIAVTYLVTDPTAAQARFALPRYRPRDIAVTYLVSDPTPARASDPAFRRSFALCVLRFALPHYRPRYIAITHLAVLRYIVLLILLVRTVTDLRDKDLRYRPP